MNDLSTRHCPGQLAAVAVLLAMFVATVHCGGPDFVTQSSEGRVGGANEAGPEAHPPIICTNCSDPSPVPDAGDDGGDAMVEAGDGRANDGGDATVESGGNDGGMRR